MLILDVYSQLSTCSCLGITSVHDFPTCNLETLIPVPRFVEIIHVVLSSQFLRIVAGETWLKFNFLFDFFFSFFYKERMLILFG